MKGHSRTSRPHRGTPEGPPGQHRCGGGRAGTAAASHFRGSRAEFVRRETDLVIPTNYLLPLDGRWIDGTIDHWGRDLGLSGDYHRFADEYLEALPGDCLVVRLRFHY
ncbi:hypothetical protein ACIBCA_02810 [Kitasatospora sp. NPDC051170]|uniref:hypothetical protein n=1 Tax=Kitasatospora sp. NPDC051170 TaxID=3364056 RepID=UPI0037B3685D